MMSFVRFIALVSIEFHRTIFNKLCSTHWPNLLFMSHRMTVTPSCGFVIFPYSSPTIRFNCISARTRERAVTRKWPQQRLRPTLKDNPIRISVRFYQCTNVWRTVTGKWRNNPCKSDKSSEKHHLCSLSYIYIGQTMCADQSFISLVAEFWTILMILIWIITWAPPCWHRAH